MLLCESTVGHFSIPSGIYLTMCQTAACGSTRLQTDHIKTLRADVYPGLLGGGCCCHLPHSLPYPLLFQQNYIHDNTSSQAVLNI